MPPQNPADPTMTYICWDCTGFVPGTDDNPPYHFLTSYGNSDPLQLPPVPDGCWEVTYEEFNTLKDELGQARYEWYEWYDATHPAGAAAVAAKAAQSEDDRIADIVAVKVAEILAAQGDS